MSTLSRQKQAEKRLALNQIKPLSRIERKKQAARNKDIEMISAIPPTKETISLLEAIMQVGKR